MNASDLDAISRRCEAARKGPWEAYVCDYGQRVNSWNVEARDEPAFGCGLNGEAWDTNHDECGHPVLLADLDFIAHARTDVPALVAWIRAALPIITRVRRYHSPDYQINTTDIADEAEDLAKLDALK